MDRASAGRQGRKARGLALVALPRRAAPWMWLWRSDHDRSKPNAGVLVDPVAKCALRAPGCRKPFGIRRTISVYVSSDRRNLHSSLRGPLPFAVYQSLVAISSSESASKPYPSAMNLNSSPMHSRAAVSISLPFSSNSSAKRLNSPVAA